ncbi:MAG TPA: pyruvoyl-dependent arginine decarboxylase [Candidatus Saccharimonadales bacterium]|nr:pyruvoyl-dependent arginine decarboxylase [Candidatus Saccharimonadales bacterium]
MLVQVSEGIGSGPTELSAFDQALVKAGVANYNLIYLSSVLPPGSKVVARTSDTKLDGGWGDRLYVVMAQRRTSQRNQEAWAGIGWIQDDIGEGLLVEHDGNSEPEVRADIEHSLEALAKNHGIKFRDPQMHIIGTKCVDLPVCALVVAVFESDPWHDTQDNIQNPFQRIAKKMNRAH